MAADTRQSNIDITELGGDGILVIEFFAPWCTQSKTQRQEFEKVLTEIGNWVNVCWIDTEQAQQMTSSFHVESIPTVLIFKDGEEFGRFVGLQTAEWILQTIQGLL